MKNLFCLLLHITCSSNALHDCHPWRPLWHLQVGLPLHTYFHVQRGGRTWSPRSEILALSFHNLMTASSCRDTFRWKLKRSDLGDLHRTSGAHDVPMTLRVIWISIPAGAMKPIRDAECASRKGNVGKSWQKGNDGSCSSRHCSRWLV